MLNPATGHFDQDWSLADLMHGLDATILQGAIQALCGPEVALTDCDGKVVLGRHPGSSRVLVPIGEGPAPLGYLVAPDAHAAAPSAVAALIGIIAHSELGYCMASALHTQVVQTDYEALEAKNAELARSEARYRRLSEQLQERVDEQVQVIERTQRQLYQAEKLASVGQLAAGLAHEINNPIAFIKSNLVTAQSYLRQLEKYRAALDNDGPSQVTWKEHDLESVLQDFPALLAESLEGAGRIARIVTDLKGFSRVDDPMQDTADLNDILRDVAAMAEPLIRVRAAISLELQPLPRLRCFAAGLGQAFYNLVLNAAEAMDRPGTIRMQSSISDSVIAVRVQDDGRGIPPDVLPRIFDPFFTTKDVGEGTGLGLTVCHDVIKTHDGRIIVSSECGQGTTFTVTLPVRK